MRAQPVMRAVSMGYMAKDAAAESIPQIDLDPQAQTVHAVVEARFTISEPTALRDPVD